MVQYAKDIIYTIKTLKEFIHIDEKGRDKGILSKFIYLLNPFRFQFNSTRKIKRSCRAIE